jgi:hypothetical protein
MTNNTMDAAVCVDGNVMMPVDVLLGADGDLVLVYTTSAAQAGGNAGHVYAKEAEQTAVLLTAQPGDYGPPKSAYDGDTLWVAHTEYRDKARRLWLHGLRQGDPAVSHAVLGPAKVDHPHLALVGGSVHLVWEDYAWEDAGGEARIVHARFDAGDLLAGNAALVQGPEAVTASRSYKPQMIAASDRLYLFYEWFYHGRYRLMARCLAPGADAFSEPVEVGFEAHNDQAVSLAIQDGKVVAVWENSRPLHKGYAWVSPGGKKVIIPNFGHGWRVNTRMGLRRVYFDDGGWHLEDLLAAPGATIDDQEAAGAPRVHVVGETLYVSYLRWDYGSATATKGWRICTKVFDGDRWVALDDAGLLQKQRVRPAVLLDPAAGLRHTFGQSPEAEAAAWSDWTQESTATYRSSRALPALPAVSSAVFATHRRPQLVRPIPTARADCARPTVAFEDGPRQLFWGDLHMHTNLSGCSLGARFHCTELEEKFRFCRDVADLDFALNTDHDSMRDYEWYRNRNSAHFHDLPGRFVAFHGYEWTCSHFDDRPNYGHYNILYKGDGPMLRTGDPRYDDVREVAAALARDDALAIPHHPGDNAHPLDWNAFDPDFAPLVEIFQVRGSYEYDGCPMHPELYGRNVVRKHAVQYGLNRGFDFGFTAGGEHEGVGVTGVYATELSRAGIFAALRERRTFGTTGDRIVVDFRLDGQPMGSRIATSAPALAGYLAVRGTDRISAVRVIKNGQVCRAWEPDVLTFTQRWDEDRTAGSAARGERDYYYVVVTQRNDEMAWTSPVFVYEA